MATVNGFDLSTYAGRQAARDANPGSIVDASSIYNPSTGQQSGGDGGGGGSGGGGSSGASNLAALSAAFNAAGTMSQKDLDERKREFDAQLQFQQDQMQKMGIPQVVINQTLARLQQDEFAFQSQMAQQQQALATAQVTGQYVAPPSGGTGNLALDAFTYKAGPGDRQTYLNAEGGDIQKAAEHYLRDVTGAVQNAVQSAGGTFTPQSMTDWVYGSGGAPQQTLAAQQQQFLQALQAGQLTGTYNGAPTLEAALQSAGLTGLYNGAPTLQAQQQAFQQQLQGSQLGLSALQAAAQLQGPQNYVQAANFARGVANSNIPVFLQNLQSGQNGPAATGGAGLSSPVSLGSLAGNMGLGGTAAAPGSSAGDLGQQQVMARQLFSNGGAALAPQALEGMTPTEQQMLGSLGGSVGADMPTFLAQYARSRIGQGAAQAA